MIIEKLLTIYFLLISANVWCIKNKPYIKNKQLATAKKVILFVAGRVGQPVYFNTRERIVMKEVYLIPGNLKRVKLERLFTKNDDEWFHYLPKTEQEQERFLNFTAQAGDEFADFLIKNQHLVNIHKRTHPTRYDEEFWYLDFWVHTEQLLKFKDLA